MGRAYTTTEKQSSQARLRERLQKKETAMSSITRIANLGQHEELSFFCPGCERRHAVPVSRDGKGITWAWNGDRDRPSLNPSIHVNANRECPEYHECHSFVVNGQIQFLNDCSHALAGTTHALPEW